MPSWQDAGIQRVANRPSATTVRFRYGIRPLSTPASYSDPDKNFYITSMSSLTHALGRNQFGNPANKGNLMPIEDAYALLNEWVPNERLHLHMRQVSAVMK